MTERSFLDIDAEIRKLQKTKYKLNTTNLIIGGSTFVGVTMYGARRIGKTTLGMLSMYELYRNWNTVLDLMFYNIKDLTKFLMACAKEDYKCPVVMFDDAGVQGGRSMYNINRALVHSMGALFDVIGTVLKGIILTTPDSDNLIKPIRRANFYKIEVIKGRHLYDRVASIYKPRKTPYDQFRLKKVAIDHFDVRLPTGVYETYYKMRKQYAIDAIENLQASIDATEQEGEHIDYNPEYTNRADYHKHHMRDWREGKKRIRSADWVESSGYA